MNCRIFRHGSSLAAMLILACGCSMNISGQSAANRLTNSSSVRQDGEKTKMSELAGPGLAANEHAPGIIVHIDPSTGDFSPGPPAGVTLPQAAQSAKTAAPPFREIPSPTPGGGVMIDLRGHFHTPLIATMGAGGTVTVQHKAITPADSENE